VCFGRRSFPDRYFLLFIFGLGFAFFEAILFDLVFPVLFSEHIFEDLYFILLFEGLKSTLTQKYLTGGFLLLFFVDSYFFYSDLYPAPLLDKW
jgi:hypothetical protein